MSRAALITWAGRVRYLPPSRANGYAYGFADSDSVRVEAAEDRAGRACVIARLTSGRAFRPVGIGAGVNYVFADSFAAGYKAVIIPTDTRVPITVLPLVLHPHEPGASPPPDTDGLLGTCIPGCGLGGRTWCRFPFDSTRAEAFLRPQDLSRLRTAGGVTPTP
jgi:hypothetical protein